ncbi:MAG: hypothetical protein NVSMB57_06430 [Actinomycetota bacterium]
MLLVSQSPVHAHSRAQGRQPLAVYLFAGQSNMVGFRARADEAAGIDLSLFRLPNVVSLSTSGGFGPEISAAKWLGRRTPIAMVKVAKSGTSLWSDWNPSVRNGLFDLLVQRTKAALAGLGKAGFAPRIAGIFWMQGESDTETLARADAYDRNLAGFVGALRAALQATDAPFMEAQIANAGAFTDLVRSKQITAADSIARATFVRTDDLERQPGDALHLSTRGTIDLGRRFARLIPSA